MQSHYPAAFHREQGCTEAEWLRWLPDAVDGHGLDLSTPGQAHVEMDGGGLHLQWQPLPPLQIALIRLPRLAVDYRFDDGVAAAVRERFMRRFDLHIQRGGG